MTRTCSDSRGATQSLREENENKSKNKRIPKSVKRFLDKMRDKAKNKSIPKSVKRFLDKMRGKSTDQSDAFRRGIALRIKKGRKPKGLAASTSNLGQVQDF
jgi:hypothetical protein